MEKEVLAVSYIFSIETKAPSTCIQIFLNPQLFLSGFKDFPDHTLADSLRIYYFPLRRANSLTTLLSCTYFSNLDKTSASTVLSSMFFSIAPHCSNRVKMLYFCGMFKPLHSFSTTCEKNTKLTLQRGNKKKV